MDAWRELTCGDSFSRELDKLFFGPVVEACRQVTRKGEAMSEHWEVGWHDRGMGHGDYGVITESEELIAKVVTGREDHARLLAAAPDLLAVCEAFLETYRRPPPGLSSLQLAKFERVAQQTGAAIAKAKQKP